MSGWLRVAPWVLALVGGALAYAVAAGRLPTELALRSLPQQAPDEHAAFARCETHPNTMPVPAAQADGTQPAPTAAGKRFAVCEREEARVTWSALRLHDDGPPLLAIGCGSSLHVIGFERIDDAIEPRRVMELRLTPHNPAEAPHAIRALAADVDGDGLRDLALTALLADASGTPRAGALYLVRQRPDGGFDSARQLLELAPIDAAVGVLDAARGADLVLVHGGDARLSRPSALWLVTGGAAPVRAAVRELSVGSRAVASCDLDGDGLDEVIDGGGDDGKLRVWPSGVLAKEPSLTLDAPHVRELACVREAANARAVVVTGDQLALLSAAAGAQPELRRIDDAQLRSVYAFDVDGEGPDELVGYAHPEVLAFARGADGYRRHTLARLAGEGAVLDARVAMLGGAPAPELLVLSTGSSTIELTVLGDVADGSSVALPTRSAPLPSTALMQRITLR